MTDDLSRRAGQPTHEALWPEDLFTQGIGWVITARFKSEGARVQAGIFLIDAFCLDAKLAVYEDCDGDDYRRGPRETEEQARGIVWQLQQRCGSGNDEYSVMLGEAGDIDRSFEE
jgi:hypothetical protein